MYGQYRYTFQPCHYMKRYVFQYKIILIATLFIILIISIAQKLHPRVNMIQDLKNDFKNDLCDTNILIIIIILIK